MAPPDEPGLRRDERVPCSCGGAASELLLGLLALDGHAVAPRLEDAECLIVSTSAAIGEILGETLPGLIDKVEAR